MHYDVVISGAGMVGATLACLLAKSSRRIAVLETFPPPEFDPTGDFELRVSALSRFSQQVLQQAGAWEGIVSRRAAAYEHMVVWDAAGTGEIHFSAAELGATELGHIVENRVVQLALWEAMQAEPAIDIFCPAGMSHFSRANGQVRIVLADKRQLSGALLVGADGSRSRVREQAGIMPQRDDYAQKGLVCVVRTIQPHQQTAWQRFMPGGPVAFLPLSEPYHSSVVWTLPADRADVLLKQSGAALSVELAAALDYRLGELEIVGSRAAFPLTGQHAEAYVQENIALVGDAAHTIHPLAGQGVNLGIKDVAELATRLKAAKNPGSLKTLRRYERARKGDNYLTLRSMEGFNLLFGSASQPLQLLRNTGLELVDGFPALKHTLARHAIGV